MQVTEVGIFLAPEVEGSTKLLAYAQFVLDGVLLVKECRLILGVNNKVFVSMPHRKIEDACHGCKGKNHLRAAYCNGCGRQLDPHRAVKAEAADAGHYGRQPGRPRVYDDLVHPIDAELRATVTKALVDAYEAELANSKKDGYISSYRRGYIEIMRKVPAPSPVVATTFGEGL